VAEHGVCVRLLDKVSNTGMDPIFALRDPGVPISAARSISIRDQPG